MLKKVMKMRVFYVFPMKKEFVDLYKETPRLLYNILRQIYYLHEEDVHYGFNLFHQIIEKNEKDHLDQYLYLKLHREMAYSKKENIHYINDLNRDEVSTLEVKIPI